MAYYRIEPFGQEADDIRWAQLLGMTYNVNRGKGPPKRLEDFMLVREPPEPLTPEKVAAIFAALPRKRRS